MSKEGESIGIGRDCHVSDEWAIENHPFRWVSLEPNRWESQEPRLSFSWASKREKLITNIGN